MSRKAHSSPSSIHTSHSCSAAGASPSIVGDPAHTGSRGPLRAFRSSQSAWTWWPLTSRRTSLSLYANISFGSCWSCWTEGARFSLQPRISTNRSSLFSSSPLSPFRPGKPGKPWGPITVSPSLPSLPGRPLCWQLDRVVVGFSGAVSLFFPKVAPKLVSTDYLIENEVKYLPWQWKTNCTNTMIFNTICDRPISADFTEIST